MGWSEFSADRSKERINTQKNTLKEPQLKKGGRLVCHFLVWIPCLFVLIILFNFFLTRKEVRSASSIVKAHGMLCHSRAFICQLHNYLPVSRPWQFMTARECCNLLERHNTCIYSLRTGSTNTIQVQLVPMSFTGVTLEKYRWRAT